MRLIAGEAQRGPIISSAIVVAALGGLTWTVLSGAEPTLVAPVVAAVTIAVLGYRTLLQWRALLALLILVILFIPIRRYTMAGNLPFELEPYRLLVAFIAFGWLASLLADPRIRLRRSGLEAPLLLFCAVVLASVVFNNDRINSLEVNAEVTKRVMFFLSFLIVFYLIVGVVRSVDDATFLVKMLVGGGAIVAVLALYEARTGDNPFDDVDALMPFLQELSPGQDDFNPNVRNTRFRASASAQHPIALSAALVMLIPLAIYLARRSPLWWLAGGAIMAGALATVSRTGVVMLLAMALTFLVLRPREAKRWWPAVLPVLVLIHFAAPGTLGTLKQSFFPRGGLIQEQRGSDNENGRIADLSPSLAEWSQKPLVGQGFGTRVPAGPLKNARILDNQWLKTLLETGVVGAFALAWLYIRLIKRAGGQGKREDSDRGWLLCSLAASLTAFVVGLYFYDAFSFIQVTFLSFILLGIGAALTTRSEISRRSRASLRLRPSGQ
jgi:hypothetical protein